jgi:hypothetical protein
VSRVTGRIDDVDPTSDRCDGVHDGASCSIRDGNGLHVGNSLESKRDDARPLDDRVELHCLCAAIVADCASASATLLAQASREWRRSLWLILAVVMGPLCPGKPSRTVVTEPAVKDEPETART